MWVREQTSSPYRYPARRLSSQPRIPSWFSLRESFWGRGSSERIGVALLGTKGTLCVVRFGPSVRCYGGWTWGSEHPTARRRKESRKKPARGRASRDINTIRGPIIGGGTGGRGESRYASQTVRYIRNLVYLAPIPAYPYVTKQDNRNLKYKIKELSGQSESVLAACRCLSLKRRSTNYKDILGFFRCA